MFQLDPTLAADTIELGDLPVCKALLMNDSQFPWVILVPRREGVTELCELDDDDLLQVQAESIAVSKCLMSCFNGDKLNTGALGNIVAQLHLHHVVRFRDDIAWPKPVWGSTPAKPYSADSEARTVERLRAELYHHMESFVATSSEVR